MLRTRHGRWQNIAEFAQNPPLLITGDNYETGRGVRLDSGASADLFGSDVHINIFNIDKINKEEGPRGKPKMKRLQETIGESYYDYLAKLDDLVLVMDEAHRYRESEDFFQGRFKSKVVEVHSALRGEESEEATERLVALEQDGAHRDCHPRQQAQGGLGRHQSLHHRPAAGLCLLHSDRANTRARSAPALAPARRTHPYLFRIAATNGKRGVEDENAVVRAWKV